MQIDDADLEAHQLESWLEGVVSGSVDVMAIGESAGLRTFTEPNIALSSAARGATTLSIRIHLSSESRPSWLTSDAQLFGYFVQLEMSAAQLTRAAVEWKQELARFPQR